MQVNSVYKSIFIKEKGNKAKKKNSFNSRFLL